MKKLYLTSIVAVVSLFCSAVLTSESAEAASGTCFFTKTNYYVQGTSGCAVTGWGSYATNDVFTGRSNSGAGSAMPASTVNSKTEFINYIVNRFNGSNVQDKVGAAYVIQRTRGVNSWPTPSDVTDWKNRMNQGSVTFLSLSNQRVKSSSWYDATRRNIFTASRDYYQDIVEIRYKNQVVMQIIRGCGNPTALQVTDVPPPPTQSPSWAVTSESRLHAPSMTGANHQWSDAKNRPTQTVAVGQPITFWHRLNNTGGSNITGNFTTYVQSYRQQAVSPSGSQQITTAPTAYGISWNTTLVQSKEIRAGGYVYFHPSYTSDRNAATLTRVAQPEDVGSFVCQRISTISAKGSSVWQYSAPACIRVVSTPGLDPTPTPQPWSVVGTSARTVNGANTGTGAPNQTIRWTHTLRLNGSSNTAPIRSNVNITGFSNGWNASHYNSVDTPTGRPVGVIRTIVSSSANRTQHVITQSDVGNTLCQQIRWAPTSSTVGTTTAAAAACVNVPYRYQLNPAVGTEYSMNTMVDPGASVEVRPSVFNEGPTKSRNTAWRLVEVVVPRSVALPGGGNSANEPCTQFHVAGGRCDQVANGNNVVFQLGTRQLDRETREVPDDLNVGDRVCWALSVRARSHDSSQWRHSNLFCLTVGKKPKVQFLGSDVRSGKRVIAAPTQINSLYYGSWAEYAILSANQVNSASGAAFSGLWDQGRSYTKPSRFNRLTFANVSPSYGHFPTSRTELPALFSSGGSSQPGSTVNPASLASGTYTYSAATLAINGGELSNRVIIRSTGNVTINGNITYADGSLSNSNLPQLVIIARNIYIAQDVTEVNAWLVASGPGGVVNTCGTTNSYTGLSSNLCNAQLRINGPVIAQRLYLRRTAGGDAGSRNAPAEILNMRPDAYIWAQNYASGSSSIKTMHIRELPPRF